MFLKKRALTFLEVVISISIFSLISLAISLIFRQSLIIYTRTNNRAHAVSEAGLVMEWLYRDISSASCLYIAGGNSLMLKTPSWGLVKYYIDTLDGNKLKRSNCSDTYVLSENVENLRFQAYDKDNNPVVNSADMKEIEIYVGTNYKGEKFMLYTTALVNDATSDCSWINSYGNSNIEAGYKIISTSDGGSLVVGDSYSYDPSSSGIVLKLDANGSLQWARSIDGDDWDEFVDAVELSDGSFVLAGTTTSVVSAIHNFFLVKIDNSGNLIWAKTIGGNDTDFLNVFKQTSDGGFLLGGYSSSFSATGFHDFLIVKTNSLGQYQWSKTYGGPRDDILNDIKIINDNLILLAGYSYSFGAGATDNLIVCINSVGNALGSYTYGSATGEYPQKMILVNKGPYAGKVLLVGITLATGLNSINFLFLNTDGTYAGPSYVFTTPGTELVATSVVQDDSSGLFVLGGYTTFGGLPQGVTMTVFPDGSAISGNRHSSMSYIKSLAKSLDGNYLFAGVASMVSDDIGVLKSILPSLGVDCCSSSYLVPIAPAPLALLSSSVGALTVLTPIPPDISELDITGSITDTDITGSINFNAVCPEY